jgi:hypothetical protein
MKTATLALVGFLAFSAPAAAAPIFSDNFEAEDLGLNEADLINWTISDGTVDVVGTGSFDSLCAGSPSPGRCVDLDGSSSNAGRIETSSIALAPGMYELIFWLSGSQRGDTNTVTVTFGALSASLTLGSAAPWTPYTFNYLSTGEATTIAFSHSGGDNLGILLDNVGLSSVDGTTAVPEPTSMVLFGTGALMALRRRRAAKSKQ